MQLQPSAPSLNDKQQAKWDILSRTNFNKKDLPAALFTIQIFKQWRNIGELEQLMATRLHNTCVRHVTSLRWQTWHEYVASSVLSIPEITRTPSSTASLLLVVFPWRPTLVIRHDSREMFWCYLWLNIDSSRFINDRFIYSTPVIRVWQRCFFKILEKSLLEAKFRPHSFGILFTVSPKPASSNSARCYYGGCLNFTHKVQKRCYFWPFKFDLPNLLFFFGKSSNCFEKC